MTQDTPDIVDPAFLNGIMQAPTANEARLVRWIDGLRQRVAELHRQLEEAAECGQRHAARVAEMERQAADSATRLEMSGTNMNGLLGLLSDADDRTRAAESQRDAALAVIARAVDELSDPHPTMDWRRIAEVMGDDFTARLVERLLASFREVLSSTPSTLRQRERAVIEAARNVVRARENSLDADTGALALRLGRRLAALNLLADAVAALSGDRHE